MTIVIEKSAHKAALSSLLSATMAFLAGLVVCAFLWYSIDLPYIVQIVIGLITSVCFLFFLTYLRRAYSYKKAGHPWRVEITSTELIWSSPVPQVFSSFTIKLSEIRQLIRRRVDELESDSQDGPEYRIEFNDGTSQLLRYDHDTINPDRVFEVLANSGIPYTKWLIRKRHGTEENPVPDDRTFDWK